MKVLLGFFLFLFHIQAYSKSCPYTSYFLKKSKMKTVHKSKERVELILSLDDQAVFWEISQTPSNSLKTFQNIIAAKIDVNWKGLVRKQLEIYKKSGFETTVFYSVLNEQMGQVTYQDCLSSLLFDLDLSFRNRYVFNAEFGAQVFRKNKSLKILFQSNRSASVAFSQQLKNEKTQLLKTGWSYLVNLHSHPFSFDNPYGDIAGTIVPSETDLKSFSKEHEKNNLQYSKITNGFSMWTLTH